MTKQKLRRNQAISLYKRRMILFSLLYHTFLLSGHTAFAQEKYDFSSLQAGETLKRSLKSSKRSNKANYTPTGPTTSNPLPTAPINSPGGPTNDAASGKSSKKSSSAGAGCVTHHKMNFLQFSAVPPAIFVDSSIQNANELGTRYIYNDDLRKPLSIDSIPSSRASGTCTRTRSRVGNAQIGLQLGMGNCHFTYSISNANGEIIFTASGQVEDSNGGVLPITGGAKSAFGAYGEVKLSPVTVQQDGSMTSNEGDFFLDPNFYHAEVDLVFPCS